MLTIRKAGSSTSYCLDSPFEGLPDPGVRLIPYHPSYTRDPLPLPPPPEPRVARWNCLDFPVWGLSRYAEMHVLMTGDDWAALSDSLDATGAVEVYWGGGADATDATDGSVSLRVVDAVPVADTRCTSTLSGAPGGEQVLWWLTLSDARLRWAEVVYTNSPYSTTAPSTWGVLLSYLAGLLGQTIDAASIDSLVHADYGRPSDVFAPAFLRGRNVSVIIDAACAAINLRALVSTAGALSFQTVSAAASALTFTATDLSTGGLRQNGWVETLSVVSYDRGGATGVYSVAAGGAAGTLTVWLPHDATGRSRYATDYAAWVARDTPDLTLAGYHAPPASSIVGRWVLDHEAAVTHLRADPAAYPWPLVGVPGATLPGDQPFNFCVVRDGDGDIIDIRITWKKPDGTFECEEVPDCPECEE
jgi:hypothetical protein